MFYELREELITQGELLIDEHFKDSANYSLQYDEISVGLASSVGKEEQNMWSCQDFITAFPLKLVSAKVVRFYKMFQGEKEESAVWVKFSEGTLHAALKPVYDEIIGQLYKKKKSPNAFTLSALVSVTKKLLELGTYQGINAGKKLRPLAASVGCLCALWLSLSSKRITKITNKRRTIRKQDKDCGETQILYHDWNFNKLSETIFCSPKTIRATYKEYTIMLMACAKKIPWIAQDSLQNRNVYRYLDDVLELYSLKPGSQPVLSLSLEEYAPLAYRISRKKEMVVQDIIELARDYDIDMDDPPEIDDDKLSLFYDVYQCLKAGFEEEELASWTIGQIQNQGELIRLRKSQPSDVNSQRNIDLNRVDIGNDDMNEEELNSYINTVDS